MKQKFPLLLIKVAFYLRLKFIFQLKYLDLLYQELEKHKSPVAYITDFQQFLLILYFYICIRANEIYQVSVVLNIFYGKRGFGAYIGINFNDFKRQVFQGTTMASKSLLCFSGLCSGTALTFAIK